MVVLRSREILPPKPKPQPDPVSSQPVTPSRTRESSLQQPSPSPDMQITGSIRPRSQTKWDSVNGFVLNERKEESLVENAFDLGIERPPATSIETRTQRRALVNGFDLNEGNQESLNENGKIASDRETETPITDSTRIIGGLESESVNGFDLNKGNEESLMGAEERETDGGLSGGLNLRSGKRVAPITVENENGRDKRARGYNSQGKNKEEAKEDDRAVLDCFLDVWADEKTGIDADDKEKRKGKEIEESDGSHSWGRRLRRQEEVEKEVDDDNNADCELAGKNETVMKGEMVKMKGEMVKNQVSNGGSSSRGRDRYNSEEKGKAKLAGDDVSPDRLKMEMESKVKDFVERLAENLERMNRMKQFRDIARENASRFAHFDAREEEGLPDAVAESSTVEVEKKVEDWPGPFSTAMKIIRDREEKLNSSHGTSASEKAERAPITWIPRNNKGSGRSKTLLPSLQELCMKILVENVDCITSLGLVPDALRHRLCQLLCDSRRMDPHFFSLLVSDSPTEIRIRDCSWLTEVDFEKCFAGCDTNNLVVLQLDQCGRCLADYMLSSSLARSPNSLPTLTTLSLSGGCRISDVGLRSIVSSAPALKSLNISCCSLLSSESIEILANSLGAVLQELYIDDCQSINAMHILPALKKLHQLQILSVAGIPTVCDDFVKEFLVERGHNMKELIFSDCVKLTDSSVEVIADTCPKLCALDLVNLWKLTDSALGYLANGCQEIQKLRLCSNSFSDEAVAAFLESSGKQLTELSLNNVKKVDHNTALSISRCSIMLQSLDLSWCRNLTDETLGLIVDSCLSLKVLKLFGCGQITSFFLHGHSNPEVRIIGLKLLPLLDFIPQPIEHPLHYS